MITEMICVDVVRVLYGQTASMTKTMASESPSKSESKLDRAASLGWVYRTLLREYSLSDLEAAVRWLELGGYIGYTGVGFHTKMAMSLTEKGMALAQNGRLDEQERALVYQEDPYSAFVARQFRDEDTPLFDYLRDSVLRPIGIKALDGRVDGIEAFRGGDFTKD